MPIFFFIHVSGVFDTVTEGNPMVTSQSFVDDLRFIASGISVNQIAPNLETVVRTVLEWGLQIL